MKRMITAVALATLASSVTFAATITATAPNTFVSGHPAIAAQVNDNFAQVYANSYQNAQGLGLTATNVQVVNSTGTLTTALHAGTPAIPNVIVLAPGNYVFTGSIPSYVHLINPGVGTVTLTGHLTLNEGNVLNNINVTNSSGKSAISLNGGAILRDVTITQQNNGSVFDSGSSHHALVKLYNVTINAESAALYDNSNNPNMLLLASDSELNTKTVSNVSVINSYQYNGNQLTVLPNS